jgi:hypothetical protein
MTTAIVGTGALGGAASAAATAAADSVTISATTQEERQPAAVQVRWLGNKGQSAAQIAKQLKPTTRAARQDSKREAMQAVFASGGAGAPAMTKSVEFR